MPQFSAEVSRSLDEYLIISGRQREGVTPDKVELCGYVTEDLYMPLSWFSAAMQCVSDDRLGIALAQYGGCSVLPRSLSIEDQTALGRRIKKAKAGFNYDVITVKPSQTISELMKLREQTGYSSFPVVRRGKLAGLITEKRYHPGKDKRRKISERMIPLEKVVTAEDGIALKDANEVLLSQGLGILPVVDRNGKYECSVFWSDIQKDVTFPNNFVDDKGRYRFAGAVSTFKSDIERAEGLVAAGCDILVIDTADLKSDYGDKMIRTLKDRFPDVPLMAGNIIDEEGFELAAEAGADVVKVGQGPGHGCTTREVKKAGRGQATAISRVAAARDEYAKSHKRIPICGDGGIGDTGLMNVAYALGSDFLMMGEYFGQFTESAAPLVKKWMIVEADGTEIAVHVGFKEHWGEASPRAANIQRYGYESMDRFVPEGDEGLIAHRGSIYDEQDGLVQDIAFVRKTLSESGALTPQEFSKRATLELQSQGSQSEGRSKV